MQAASVCLFILAGSCLRTAPSPKSEGARIPELFADGQFASENSGIDIELLIHMPDPEFQADRLNPGRYTPSELSFSCVGHCPDNLEIDPKTGAVKWEPGFEDAGIHYVTYQVESDLFSARKTIPIVVVDRDRAPVIDQGTDGIVEGAEASLISFQLSASDPDGDSVAYRCADGCPPGLTMENGKLNWVPDYNQSGNHSVRLVAESLPAQRDIVVRGLAPGVDSELARREIERETIDRNKISQTSFVLSIEVANTDRPPKVAPVENRIVAEAQELSFTIVASDPDGDSIEFLCGPSCPDGMRVDGDSGEVQWRPNFEQSGDYAVEFALVSGDQLSQAVPARTKVTNTNRAPFLLNVSDDIEAKEGELITMLLPATDLDLEDTLLFKCSLGCPDGLSVDPLTGQVEWVPGFHQSGVYHVGLEVSDGRLEVHEEVKVTVEHVNRPPEWTFLPLLSVSPAMRNLDLKLIAVDPDPEDEGKVRYRCESCPAGVSIDSLGGRVRWFPQWSDEGSHPLILSASDGLTSTAGATILKITKSDRLPVFSEVTPPDGEEFLSYQVSVKAVDPDGDQIRYECVAGCGEKIVVNPLSGLVHFTPGARDSGDYSLLIRASSNPAWDLNQSETKYSDLQLRFFIKNNNRLPVIDSVLNHFQLFENGHVSQDFYSVTGRGLDIQLSAFDVDEDPLAYVCVENCPAGLIVNPRSGKVSWTPSYDQALLNDAPYVDITLGVTDGEATVSTNPFSVTVRNVNRPPVITDPGDDFVYEQGHQSELETSPLNSPLHFQISAVDEDGDALTFGCFLNCPTGLTVHPQTGGVDWVPSYNQARGGEQSLPYENIVYSVSDGSRTLYTSGHSITVKNVNRIPRLNPLASTYSIFEMGHRSTEECPGGVDVCGDRQDRPLRINLIATDPDGDPLNFKCRDGCPVGLSVNTSSGEIFWRPAYLSSGDNEAALPENASRPNIIFQVADYKDVVLSNSVEIVVNNVDRGPRISGGLADLSFFENSPTFFHLNIVDPDGDVAESSCKTVVLPLGQPRLDFSNPSSNCTDGYVSSPGNGHQKWLTVDSVTSRVDIDPGYYDALKNGDSYTVTYEAKSSPDGFSAMPSKVVTFEHEILIKNIDRPPPIASPLAAPAGYENNPIEFSLFAGNDPDFLHGEFDDLLEFSCVGEVDASGASVGPCPTDNLPSDEAENSLLVDKDSGLVKWTPSYLHAKFRSQDLDKEEPYRLRFRVTSTPDGFQSSPLSSETVINVTVLNNDRLPRFLSNPPPETVHLWEPDAAVPGNAAHVDSTTISIFGDDPTKFPTVENFTREAVDLDNLQGLRSTDEIVSYRMLGCSPFPDAIPTEMNSCPDWVELNQQTGALKLAPDNFDAALANNGVRYVSFIAVGCPLETTGWECGAPFETPVEQKAGRVTVPVLVHNVDRPPTLNFDDAPLVLLESASDLRKTVTWNDPDGSEVRICIELNQVFTEGVRVKQSSVAQKGVISSFEGEEGGTSCAPGKAVAANGSTTVVIKGGGYSHVERHDGGIADSNLFTFATTDHLGQPRYGRRDYALKVKAYSSDENHHHPDNPEASSPAVDVAILNDDRAPSLSVGFPASRREDQLLAVTLEFSDQDCEDRKHLELQASYVEPKLTEGAAKPSLESVACGQTSRLEWQYTTFPEAGGEYNLATHGGSPSLGLDKIYRPGFKVCYGDQPDVCFTEEFVTMNITNVIRPPEFNAPPARVGGRSADEKNMPRINFSYLADDARDTTLPQPRLIINHVAAPISRDYSSNLSAGGGSGTGVISFGSGHYDYVSSCPGCSEPTEICPRVRYTMCYIGSNFSSCGATTETEVCFTNHDRKPTITNCGSGTAPENIQGALAAINFCTSDPDPEDRPRTKVAATRWSAYHENNFFAPAAVKEACRETFTDCESDPFFPRSCSSILREKNGFTLLDGNSSTVRIAVPINLLPGGACPNVNVLTRPTPFVHETPGVCPSCGDVPTRILIHPCVVTPNIHLGTESFAELETRATCWPDTSGFRTCDDLGGGVSFSRGHELIFKIKAEAYNNTDTTGRVVSTGTAFREMGVVTCKESL